MESSVSNVTEIIIQTINTIFEKLFSSVDNNLYGVLDNLTFISSDILKDKYFERFFGTSSVNGLLLVANSFLLAFLLYYGLRFLLSNFTFTKIETPYQFIFKIIFFGILMNCSFFLVDKFISIIYYLSISIKEIGESLLNTDISFSSLIMRLNKTVSVDSSSIEFFSFDGFIKSFITFGLLNLVLSYSLRYIFVKIFILLTPFAILSLSTNSTSWIFKSWIKNFFACLFLQIIISLILVLLFSMDFDSNNLLSKFIYVGAIYALIRANSFVYQFLGGLSTDVTHNVGNFSNFIKK